MNENSIRNWIHANPGIFGKMVSMAFLLFGVLVVIGAIRDWDWLFKPDQSYHNKWTIGQVSRYLGRNPARVVGFVGGLFLIICGSIWSYRAFTRT
jgi:hypothetical protein